MKNVKAAYIHIPFCEHICHYCDFNKVFLKGQPVDEYLTTLGDEMRLTLKDQQAKGLSSIFVGGGTPTSLNAHQLEQLCSTIDFWLPKNETMEYSFEANPGDLSEDKLKILYHSGVNRLSFGVQSFNDELLKKIGRTHTAKDVFVAIESAKKVGFSNISIDLIYSLPGQTLADFKDTLKTSLTLETEHISGYSLIIEPKTVFYQLMRKGQLNVPGEDLEAAMYEVLIEEMVQHGYAQYEISNFAKPGYESKHNITYWDNDEYYGFGAGAHCYVNGVRRSNYGPLKKYMTPIQNGCLPILEEHTVTQREMMEEEMFLGLRKVKGVSISRFIEKFSCSPFDIFASEINDLKNKELLQIKDDTISLTHQGLFLGNEVFQSFLS